MSYRPSLTNQTKNEIKKSKLFLTIAFVVIYFFITYPIKNELNIAVLFLLSISGICKAVMDTLQFHYDNSIFTLYNFNNQFWNPKFSWRNKYSKHSQTVERFPLSTTIFVFITDAWHLFQAICFSILFTIIISSNSITITTINAVVSNVIEFLFCTIYFGIPFLYFFRYVFTISEDDICHAINKVGTEECDYLWNILYQ
jgi:hypothetical protein